MSQPASDSTQGALLVQEQAAAWLRRSLDAQWGEKDQAAFDGWMAASAAHKLAYWRLSAAWGRSERLAALRPSPASPTPRRRRVWPIVFAATAAGIAAIALLVANGTFLRSQPTFQTFATPVGGRQVLRLADGSQIELNTNTVVQVLVSQTARTVNLEKGEAFFEIKHNAARPFVVNVGSHRVVDLGTKFLVREDPRQLQVTLVEGKARLESANAGTQALLLTPGNVAVATATTMSVTSNAPTSLADQLGWRRGLLIFGNAPLEAVAAEFNRYNTTKLVIADAQTAKIAVGGTFQANDVRTFAEVARGLLHLKVAYRDREIVISR